MKLTVWEDERIWAKHLNLRRSTEIRVMGWAVWRETHYALCIEISFIRHQRSPPFSKKEYWKIYLFSLKFLKPKIKSVQNTTNVGLLLNSACFVYWWFGG
jgi:hypothetical protein